MHETVYVCVRTLDCVLVSADSAVIACHSGQEQYTATCLLCSQ